MPFPQITTPFSVMAGSIGLRGRLTQGQTETVAHTVLLFVHGGNRSPGIETTRVAIPRAG